MIYPNIDKFNEITGQALAKLYQNFPVPLSLGAFNLIEGGKDACYDSSSFTGADLTPQAEFVMATLDWLAQAGYLRYQDKHNIGFSGVVLTPAGLNLLNAVPDALQGGKEPMGARLVAAMRAGTAHVLGTVANQVLSKGVGLGLEHALNHLSWSPLVGQMLLGVHRRVRLAQERTPPKGGIVTQPVAVASHWRDWDA